MPEILASVKDGNVSISNANFSTARDATSGTSFADAQATSTAAIRCAKVSFRGSFNFFIVRSFFEFDTSGISTTPSAATLKLYGQSTTSADFFVVKSTVADGATLSFAEFDSIDGWSAGADNSSNVTKYSSEVTSWSTGAYNNITLTSDALSDMASEDNFKICLIQSSNDLENVEATAVFKTGVNLVTGLARLIYTEGSTGYSHNVSGVASANIASVNGVATANIASVNGVDT